MMDKFHEECGIFGIYGAPEAANLAYLGLYSLQHRGQESAGIVSSDGEKLYSEISMGLVADIFNEERLKRLPGSIAIGHNRYSTTGSSLLKNAQPFLMEYLRGSIALAHNGNLLNALKIRDELENQGSIFRSAMDSEVIVHLIAMSREKKLVDRITEALRNIKGAYSLLVMSEKELIAVRDPHGFRPLCLGLLGDSYVFSSETCALDLIEAKYIRDVEPGEIVVVNEKGLKSFKPFPAEKYSHCIFEFVYFARPDSNIFGKNVYSVRKNLGRILAQESYVDADMVVAVPDSGVPAALGFSEESGIPLELGLIRNHYVGRTFIEPRQSIRHFGVKVKLNAIRDCIKGKRVIVIDDSIIRGTTSRKIIQMIRSAGAKEVHMRISSPPATNPCFYGIDTPTKAELVASSHSVEEINQYITSDTLTYLSLEGLKSTVYPDQDNYCCACFEGNYPIEFEWKDYSQLILFGKNI
ncbi:MAG TPA: amidophosphoribosyltransferase [Nitrospinota bacterium]|nr:amidophosphoribosyltransferase [Nitrospinota bacterium]